MNQDFDENVEEADSGEQDTHNPSRQRTSSTASFIQRPHAGYATRNIFSIEDAYFCLLFDCSAAARRRTHFTTETSFSPMVPRRAGKFLQAVHALHKSKPSSFESFSTQRELTTFHIL